MSPCCVLLSFFAVACARAPELDAIGEITAIDVVHGRLTVKHDGIPGITAASPLQIAATAEALGDLAVSERIHFVVSQQGGQLRLVRAERRPLIRPGIHDHTPHHGGVVVMIGMIHLEALATSNGRVRVYLTDVWRKPLPLDDVNGTITFNLPGAKIALPIVARSDFVEVVGPPLTRSEVNVSVALQRRDGPVDMTFQLPLQRDAIAAVGLGAEGCVAAQQRSGVTPRCVVQLAAPACALASSPQGGEVLVAGVGVGVTVWSLPEMRLRRSLPPPPPIAALPGEAPHVDAVGVIRVSPDGQRVLVGSENRLSIYSLSAGELLQELPWRNGTIRDASWHPDGRQLLVASFYHAAAELIGAQDGLVVRSFPVEREAASVAVSPDGRLMAVGDEQGDLRIWAQAEERARTSWTTGDRAVRALAFVDDVRLLSLSEDGRLRVWSVANGAAIAARASAGFPALALDRESGRLAVGGRDGTIEVVDTRADERIARMAWHERAISGLAWGTGGLVSADEGGEIAVWDAPALATAVAPGPQAAPHRAELN